MSEFLSLGLGKIGEINQISLRVRDSDLPKHAVLPREDIFPWASRSDTCCEERLGLGEGCL